MAELLNTTQPEQRVPRTPLIAPGEWLPAAPIELDPLQLFESRLSYRLLGGALAERWLDIGLAATSTRSPVRPRAGGPGAAR